MRGIILLLGLAIACAKVTPEPSILELSSIPAADVIVDGKAVGKTPIEYELAPGSHAVVFRAASFVVHEKTIEIGKSERKTLDVTLTATDPRDPAALRKLGGAFDLEFVDLEDPVRMRGAGDDDWIIPSFPRGRVLLGDLDDFRLDVGLEFEVEGDVQFRRGSKTLATLALDPKEDLQAGPLPKEVIASVTKKAGTISWGFYPKKGKPITGKFTVVKRDSRLDKRLASLDKRLKGQPKTVASQLRAQLFLNKRYDMAAYREARIAFDTDPEAAQAVAIMQSALRRMKLTEGPLWVEVQASNAGLPGKMRKRLEQLRKR